MNRKINTLYFSATGTTEKIVLGIAETIAQNNGEKAAIRNINFTSPETRKESFSFDSGDIVIVGMPVYAGRIPNVLLKFLNTLSGNKAAAVAVVLYGNRHYDDALIELNDILESNGFHVIAAGAFIGEHSFSTTLGASRPDGQDMAIARSFALNICDKMKAHNTNTAVVIPGTRPYREYYRPKDQNGNIISILKVIPKTNDDCIDCKVCAEVCPMGSIDSEDVHKITGICIKCCACIKKCPVGAKYFDDENYLWHKHELEIKYTDTRREPEYFV